MNGKKVFDEIRKDFLEGVIKDTLSQIKDENEQKVICKSVLDAFKENKPFTLTKKFEKYIEDINHLIQILKEEESKIILFSFQKCFEAELAKFNLILLYAPVFESIIANGNLK